MPRIRSLKPEALQHRKVGSLSDRAFRVWIGCLSQADDEGRLVVDAEQFRVLFFGYHRNVTAEDVQIALDEVVKLGLIRAYSVRGVHYADFPSWREHQRIDRPTRSKLPSYEEFASTRTRRRLGEGSTNARRSLAADRIGSEGIGKERNGGELEGRATSTAPAAVTPPGVSPGPPVAVALDSTNPNPSNGTEPRFEDVLRHLRARSPGLSDNQLRAAGVREVERFLRTKYPRWTDAQVQDAAASRSLAVATVP